MNRTDAFWKVPVEIQSRPAWDAVALSGLVLCLAILSGWVLGSAALVYAVALPAGILFGFSGAVGFAMGNLFAALASGTVSVATPVQVCGDLVLVAIGTVLWNGHPIPGRGNGPREFLSAFRTYVFASIFPLLCHVSVLAIGFMLVDRLPVAATVPLVLLDRVGPLLAVGPVVLVLLGSFVDRRATVTTGLTVGQKIGGGGIALTWLAGIFAFGLIRQDITSIPGVQNDFARYFPETIAPTVLWVVETLYIPLQLVGTGVVVVLLFEVLVRRPRAHRDQHEQDGETTL